MRTYDLVMLVVLAVWWLFYRKKYKWKAVVLWYVVGVMFADLGCAVLILAAYHRYPGIISVPAFLMPAGGMAGLVYASSRDKLNKDLGGLANDKEREPTKS